jgi:Flp pilus assembly protein TadD
MKAIASTNSKAVKTSTAWWICALLVLGVVAVYWPVVGYAFTDLDDPQYVAKNQHVLNGLSWSGVVWAFTTFSAANWHPLTWLSHMLDIQLFGMQAGGHHVTSVLFHAANTVLLFLLLKRLTNATWRSALVAALFGFHPLHVESVAWVAERKDVLSTFFFLLTLGAYTRYAQNKETLNPQPSTFNYTLALFFFALGLMSKPMLVTLPFVLLLLDYWPLGRMSRDEGRGTSMAVVPALDFRLSTFDSALLFEKLPFFALSAASCAVTILAQKHALMPVTFMPIEMRIQNALIAYVAYLEKMLWPDKLAAYYPLHAPIDTNKAIVAAFVLLLISAGVFIFRRQRPWLVTGWLWYLGTLVPVIGLVQVGAQSMADRYTYVPLIGIFIALTWSLGDIPPGWRYRRALMTVVSVAVLGICLTLTAAQVRYWQNGEILARHGLAVTAENSSMHLLLGDALSDQGKAEEAGRHFAEAARICPDSAPAQCGLAVTLVVRGRLDEAVETCRAALQILPREPKIHYVLANTLSAQGKLAEAIAEYKEVLQYDSKQLFALNDLAWLLATVSDSRFRDGPEAVRLAERACQLSNYKVTLYMGTLAAAYAEAGRFDDAVKTAQKAVALATAAKQERLAGKNRELLELYQLKKAYHEPAGTNEPN